MNRQQVIVTLIFLILSCPLMAQQRPHYTQYVLNNYVLNPALSGIENYTDLRISHRHQWVGLQDAPVTTCLTVHTPIGKKDYKPTAMSVPMKGENPRGSEYWKNYEVSAPHHGIGLQLVNDKTGPLSNFSLYGTYAYHLSLNSRTSLAGGMGVGFSRVNLNTSKLFFGPANPVDPVVYGSGILGKTQLDMNAGLFLYSADYFLGASMMQVIPQRLDFSDNTVMVQEGKKVPHLFFTAGYRFLLGEDINALPSVMVKNVQPLPVQAEASLKLQYRDLLWAGASYRFKYGFAGMAGLSVANSFQLSYSYDYSTTRLNTVSSGTHEIMIGFILGNNYSGETCPRNVW